LAWRVQRDFRYPPGTSGFAGRMQKKLIAAGVMLVSALAMIFFLTGFRQTANLAAIVITSVQVTSAEIGITGDFTGSSMGYAGCAKDFHETKLYLTIKSFNGFQPAGLKPLRFSIPNIYPDLTAIYLADHSGTEPRLIW
jgi:hypothetical protein